VVSNNIDTPGRVVVSAQFSAICGAGAGGRGQGAGGRGQG
jgi:hypothetical protein